MHIRLSDMSDFRNETVDQQLNVCSAFYRLAQDEDDSSPEIEYYQFKFQQIIHQLVQKVSENRRFGFWLDLCQEAKERAYSLERAEAEAIIFPLWELPQGEDFPF